MIAAASSGSGKTTLTIGLLRALSKRGLKVQPFKCGPDYIDTKYHESATGNPSVNLDLFLSTPEKTGLLYQKYEAGKDVCIVEGVMGLFDGYNRTEGSSANIARLLGLPVILVVDARSMAYSAAALLYGFKYFRKEINIAGVIFNFVASASHYHFLKEACDDVGLRALGYLPKNSGIEVPSRHLGLTLDEAYCFDGFADKAALLLEEHVDINQLLRITEHSVEDIYQDTPPQKGDMVIAVARDEAFNFMYHENIESLKRMGKVVFFSPLNDAKLPEADLLYLPGGYPELYLEKLSNNQSMIAGIRDYAEKGGRLLAECGGMMYLSTSITDKDGRIFPMANILKQTASMKNMKLKLGYRQFEYNGVKCKGHEFHYSSIDSLLESVTQQYDAKGAPVDTKLIRYKNVVAGYTHLYWGDMDNLTDIFK